MTTIFEVQDGIHVFQTEIMKTEFERLQARLPMDMMSMKRYELPQPPPGKMTDVSSWNECVENSQAQLEHQALRYYCNITLLEEVKVEAFIQKNRNLFSLLLYSRLFQGDNLPYLCCCFFCCCCLCPFCSASLPCFSCSMYCLFRCMPLLHAFWVNSV